jgi:hypothetical protein
MTAVYMLCCSQDAAVNVWVVVGLGFCKALFAQLGSGKVQVVATANMCRRVGSI